MTTKKPNDSSDPIRYSIDNGLLVFLIDDEDMIVAKNERKMKRIYRDYHGKSIHGHDWRLIPPNEMIPLTDGSEEWAESAASFGQSKSRYVATCR